MLVKQGAQRAVGIVVTVVILQLHWAVSYVTAEDYEM